MYEYKKNLMHNNLLNALDIHGNMFNHKFELKKENKEKITCFEGMLLWIPFSNLAKI